MGNMTEKLRTADAAFREKVAGVARDVGVAPQPLSVRLMSPMEALENRLKLPWDGKVEPSIPACLTLQLFNQLEAYGLRRQSIKNFFGFKNDPAFYVWIKKNGILPKESLHAKSQGPEPPPVVNPSVIKNSIDSAEESAKIREFFEEILSDGFVASRQPDAVVQSADEERSTICIKLHDASVLEFTNICHKLLSLQPIGLAKVTCDITIKV